MSTGYCEQGGQTSQSQAGVTNHTAATKLMQYPFLQQNSELIADYMVTNVIQSHYPSLAMDMNLNETMYPIKDNVYHVLYGCEVLINAILRRVDEVILISLFNIIGAEQVLSYQRPMYIQQVTKSNTTQSKQRDDLKPIKFNIFDFINAANTIDYAPQFSCVCI
eukprot:UN02803